MKIECHICGKKFCVANYQEEALCPECGAHLQFPPQGPPKRRPMISRRCACGNPKCNFMGRMALEPDPCGWLLAAFLGLVPGFGALLFLPQAMAGIAIIAYFLPLLIWAGARAPRRYICPICGTPHP